MRKRWLPYLLFAIMVLGAAITIWLAGLTSYYQERDAFEYNYGADALRTFVLPYSLVTLLDVGQFYGAALISVLIASTVATEYGWGTVRQALVRGQTRSGYLTAKLLGAAIMSTVLLLAALLVGLVFSVIATSIADQSITLDAPGFSILDIPVMVLRTALAILPYALLAFCLAVVGRSTTVGIVGTFLYMFVLESILIAILGGLPDPAPHFRGFFLGHNASAMLAANRISSDEYYGFALRDELFAAELPDPWFAALVLLAFSALFTFIAYYVFQRRDLGTDGGGG
jgi:ABC-type transport system involved in multi-copper enzyme maturation permease subunit